MLPQRPSLHDIMRDFVVAAKSDEQLRAANRRLVELWRAERPPGGWDMQGAEGVSQYMGVAAPHHIRGAWGVEWAEDAGAIAWLSDFVGGQQDAIPVHAADALGAAKVAQLAGAAEAAGDWWDAALRWSASALAAHQIGGHSRSLPLDEASANALERVRPGRDACTQEDRDQLEMQVLVHSLQSYSPRPNELGFAPRLSATLERLGKANPESVNVTNNLIVLQFAEQCVTCVPLAPTSVHRTSCSDTNAPVAASRVFLQGPFTLLVSRT
jgi:hypothetical protein